MDAVSANRVGCCLAVVVVGLLCAAASAVGRSKAITVEPGAPQVAPNGDQSCPGESASYSVIGHAHADPSVLRFNVTVSVNGEVVGHVWDLSTVLHSDSTWEQPLGIDLRRGVSNTVTLDWLAYIPGLDTQSGTATVSSTVSPEACPPEPCDPDLETCPPDCSPSHAALATEAQTPSCPPDPCSALSPSTPPLARDYVNQYDVGQELGLPTSNAGRKRGGNACGVSSLIMAINALKGQAGDGSLATSARNAWVDMRGLYDATSSAARTGDGVNSGFVWQDVKAVAESYGYHADLHLASAQTMQFLDDSLGSAAQVLVSSTFSTSGGVGGGHVVLIHGKTASGDYIVRDPAGDQSAGGRFRYGGGKCGYDRVYSAAEVRSHVDGRPALAIYPTPGADPRLLIVELPTRWQGRLWLEDAHGRRAGWGRRGAVSEIPGSRLDRDPELPSDPDAPPVRTVRYRPTIVITDPPARLRLRTAGTKASSPPVRLVQVQAGALITNQVVPTRPDAGTWLDITPPHTSLIHRTAPHAFTGLSVDDGIRYVEYTVQDIQTGRFLTPGGSWSKSVRPLRATLVRWDAARGGMVWRARLPGAVRPKQPYRLYVAAADGYLNRDFAADPLVFSG